MTGQVRRRKLPGLMPARHDRLCKQFLLESLDPISTVAVHKTVAPQDDQYVDNFCVPRTDAPPAQALVYLGQLRDMVSAVCMIESSSRPPSPADLDNNQRKQLNLQRQLVKENGGRYVQRPWLWMLSTGRPRQLIGRCGFVPVSGRPRGFYGVDPWLRTGLVVLSELPDSGDTLALRLLGSPLQRKQALKELGQLPKADPICGPLLEIVAKVRYFIAASPDVESDAEERSIMTELGIKWEQYKADFVRRIESEMRDEGAVAALQDGVLTILRARHLRESKALAKRVRSCSNQALLKRWLERAAVAKTPAEVFAES